MATDRSEVNKGIAHSVAKNTSVMLGQYVLSAGSSFLLMMFLPRYLGPVEYGRLFLAYSIISIFRIFVEYGGNYLIAKNVSRSPESTARILVDSTALRFFIALLSFAGAIALTFLVDYSLEQRLLIIIVGLGLLWKSGMVVLVASYQGHERMQYTSAATLAEAVFMSLVGIVALLLGARAMEIAIISTVSSLLNFSLLLGFSKRIAASLPRIHWGNVAAQIKEGLPYFLMAVFSTIYYRIDSLMLSKMTPEAVVGWYGGAHRLFEVLNSFPVIFSTAVYPVLSRLWVQEEQTHKRTTQRSLELMILIGIPVSIAAVAFAEQAVQLLYGLPAYMPSVVVLQVLAAGVLLFFVDMVIGTTLMASNKQREQSILALCAIPLTIGLNYFLIPYYQTQTGNGGIGAGIATIVTELFIMIAGLSLLPKGLLSGFRYSFALKSAAAGIAMAAFLWFTWSLGLPWYARAALCLVVYVAVLLSLKTFERKELSFFMGLMKFRYLTSIATGSSRP